MSAIGTLIALAVIFIMMKLAGALVKRWRAGRDSRQERERWVGSALTDGASAITLVAILGLAFGAWACVNQVARQGSPTTAVIASASDHTQVEKTLAQFGQTIGTPSADRYVTTQVSPVAINGVAIDDWVRQLDPNGQMQPQNLQHRLGKFAAIQGFDLARGQVPDGAQIGFSADDGAGVEHNLGRDGVTIAPKGRLLDTNDAGTLNVLIPTEANWTISDQVCCVDFYVGNTITVQSRASAGALTLHVVGVYEEDGAATNFFGGILADASVAQTLSDDAPTYAYALRLDAGQRDALAHQLQAGAPAVQVTALTDRNAQIPGATFTDLLSEQVWWLFANWGLVGRIVTFWSLLTAVLIFATAKARPLLRGSRVPAG